MNAQNFIEQKSSQRIMQYITRYCAECFKELSDGEKIFYDLENYRYICEECTQVICEKLYEIDEVEIATAETFESEGLFQAL